LEHVAQGEFEGPTACVDRDGLRTGFVLDRVEALDDEVVRLVPRDALELERPLRADAPQGMPEAVLRVDDLGGVGPAPADHAERVTGVRPDVLDLPVPHPHLDPASRGTDAADSLLPVELLLSHRAVQ
jgi:hypothetical protein